MSATVTHDLLDMIYNHTLTFETPGAVHHSIKRLDAKKQTKMLGSKESGLATVRSTEKKEKEDCGK
jgi:hypothetical protein